MTKELFEKYPHICAEISDLKKREGAVVSDTVSGSSPEYPYTKHPIGIKGVAPLSERDNERLQKLKREKEEIEAWVEAFHDTEPRKWRLLCAVMKHGKKWNKIRYIMGGSKGSNATRMEYERIFEKN